MTCGGRPTRGEGEAAWACADGGSAIGGAAGADGGGVAEDPADGGGVTLRGPLAMSSGAITRGNIPGGGAAVPDRGEATFDGGKVTPGGAGAVATAGEGGAEPEIGAAAADEGGVMPRGDAEAAGTGWPPG